MSNCRMTGGQLDEAAASHCSNPVGYMVEKGVTRGKGALGRVLPRFLRLAWLVVSSCHEFGWIQSLGYSGSKVTWYTSYWRSGCCGTMELRSTHVPVGRLH